MMKVKTIVDENGDRIVVIRERLFENRDIRRNYSVVVKKVKSMFSQLEGKHVVIKDNKKEVFFDKHSADEYTRSRDTLINKVQYKKTKLNAVKEIKAIVKNAKYNSHKELIKTKKDAKSKRGIDASNGFDYYVVKFAFENEGGDYVLFSGILNVRIDKSEKCFVYDITKISEIQLASGKPLSTPL